MEFFTIKIKKMFSIEFTLLVFVAVFEIFHVQTLFGNASFLAGGDNYSYLQLGRIGFYPYVWDSNYVALGGVSVAIPNLLGFPVYSYIFHFLSNSVLEKLLIYTLYLFRYVAFVKLIKLISKKISVFALIPALLLLVFNAFESLNPFSLFPLMQSVYLPFSFYYFIKLYSSDKSDFADIAKLILLSVVFSPINANLPLAVAVYIPQFVYILFFIRNMNKAKILNILAYYVLLLFVNLWWVFPLLLYFVGSAVDVFSGSWFSAVSVGHLVSNFRFMGQWGWYGSHFLYNYYPFSKYYDNFFVVIATYSIILIAFLGGSIKKINNSDSRKFHVFFLFLALVSLFFVGGTRPPFGFVYSFLYNNIFGFKMFREPFTKFSELYVLSACILFYYSLLNLEKYFEGQRKVIAFFGVLIIVLVSIKPVLFGEHVWSKWNGSMRTFRVNVPDYWEEFSNYVAANISNSRILTTPKVYYGAAWNWPSGISSADDIAVNFVGMTNNVLRNPLSSVSGRSGEVINNVFNSMNLPKNYLAVLGISYVLQENDLDWRYSPLGTYAPDKNSMFMQKLGLEKVTEFGNLSKDYLATLANDEPNDTIKDELYSSLIDKPALVLYKLAKDQTLPRFYVPKNIVYSSGKNSDLPYVLEAWGTDIRSAYFLDRFSSDRNVFLNLNIMKDSNSIVLFPQRLTTHVNMNSLAWEPGWLWPEVNVDPETLEYNFLMFKEYIDLLTTFKDLDRIDVLTWYSAKRIAELERFYVSDKKRETLTGIFLSTVSKDFDVFSKVPESLRNDKFWDFLHKFLVYMEKSFTELSIIFDFDKHPEMLSLRKKIMDYVLSINGISCGEFCFKLIVPESGKYSLYIDTKLIETLDLNKDTSIQKTLDPVLFLKDLQISDWQDFGKTNKFAYVKSWEDEMQYKVSFDYRTNSGRLSFVLIEEIPKKFDSGTIERKNVVKELLDTFSIAKNNIPKILGSKYCKYIENGECYSHYERVVKSSKNTDSVLALFDFSNVSFPVKNLKVQKVTNPQVRLVKLIQDTSKNNKIMPKIEFEEINPTKYLVHVSSAKDPYYLVFNEAFNKGWKVYPVDGALNDTKEFVLIGWIGQIAKNLLRSFDIQRDIRNVTKINYFEDSIIEKNGQYIFLNSETFDTWGKQDIMSDRHYLVNGFANSWLVQPADVNNSAEYDLIIEFWPQRFFYIAISIFFVIVTSSIFYISLSVIRKKYDW